ncbi:unnamed protein product [Mesocestoides corti]|uniref:Uncharacterized protein n=1 Tax=Mesocestoides corti TaxID=53468 RepID=A0A0R3UEG0_MESCO|nr:unnamed protein product [Mesocestoides corti]
MVIKDVSCRDRLSEFCLLQLFFGSKNLCGDAVELGNEKVALAVVSSNAECEMATTRPVRLRKLPEVLQTGLLRADWSLENGGRNMGGGGRSPVNSITVHGGSRRDLMTLGVSLDLCGPHLSVGTVVRKAYEDVDLW